MSNFSLAALAPRTCLQCGAIFVPPKRSSKYCSPPCFHKAQEKTKINHPKKGDIPGLIDKNKSRDEQRAHALLDAVDFGLMNIFTASKETRKAIALAQDLTKRRIKV